MIAQTNSPFIIAGVGCCLLDYIYARIDFCSPSFKAYCSLSDGDGGLVPGKLSFTEDFETFSGREMGEVLQQQIAAGQSADAINIGGPAVVALIHASQILDPSLFNIRFSGVVGEDAVGVELRRQLALTPLSEANLIVKSGRTPRTIVLSDPGFDQGRGERTFLNTIGVASELTYDDLSPDFFKADMLVFGGTALVPKIHDALDRLLTQAKLNDAFTVVNTIYDFRHQQQDPNARWPLGSSDKSYGLIDLLIADFEEALRLSGTKTLDEALFFFVEQGVGAVVVTNGARDVSLRTNSTKYAPLTHSRMPASQAIVAELVAHPERKGDTTGCGDNFAGGVIANVALQLKSGKPRIDLAEAIACGVVSGGLACFQMGGVFHESHRGQKKELLEPYLDAYCTGLRHCIGQ